MLHLLVVFQKLTIHFIAEDLDILMLMYNLLEYSKIYSKTKQEIFGFTTEMSQIVVQVVQIIT